MLRKVSHILFFALLLSLANVFELAAQNIPSFGLKGGVNFSTFAQTDIEGYETKAGTLIGAFVEISIPTSSVSIQPEFIYSQFGSGVEDTDLSFNVNYIQVPVLVKISINTLGAPQTSVAPKITPNIVVGPYANFLINAELDGDGGSVEIDEVTRNTAFGLLIGGGVTINKLDIGVRVSAGLSDVFEEEFSDGEKNLGVGLTIGVKL